MTRFAIDTLQIHSTSMSAVTLRGVGSVSHALNRNTVGPDSGDTYDEDRFTLDIDDEFNIGQVTALESLLTVVSALTGKCVDDDGSHPGLQLFGQSYSRCGTKGRGASGTHAKVTAKLAHMFVTEFGGSRNTIATAALRCVNLLKSGETRPSVTVYNATLPTTYVGDEMFKVGPVQLDGTSLDENSILSVNVSTGIELQVVKNLNGFATDIIILKVRPVIRIVVDDASVHADSVIPYEGLPLASSDSKISFLRLDPDGTVIARASSEHITVGINGKAYCDSHLEGGGNTPSTNTIVIETLEASGTAPLVVALNQAVAF